jgi:hypothetical protein
LENWALQVKLIQTASVLDYRSTLPLNDASRSAMPFGQDHYALAQPGAKLPARKYFPFFGKADWVLQTAQFTRCKAHFVGQASRHLAYEKFE